MLYMLCASVDGFKYDAVADIGQLEACRGHGGSELKFLQSRSIPKKTR